MGRLIDADDFGNRMYHEAFEKDSEDQRWDSGCWIRYKLFERVLREQPTVQPQTSMLTVECKFDDEELAKAIERVKRANLELIAAEPHWIPVTERLPEICNYYIVTDFNKVDEAYYNSDGRWFSWDGNKLKDVTAWMPLPEPYKGGEQE